MKKCRNCGKKLSNQHPDLAGVFCQTCRLLPKISTVKEQIGIIQPDKSAGYSQIYRNLTVGQVNKLQAKQAGHCAICSRKLFLVLDHDHKTGKARGYLCRGCNTKLSGFDNPDFVAKVKAYLDSPPAENI